MLQKKFTHKHERAWEPEPYEYDTIKYKRNWFKKLTAEEINDSLLDCLDDDLCPYWNQPSDTFMREIGLID